MTTVLRHLIRFFDLVQVEENLFRGKSQDLGFPHLFGGHVLGQALAAAGNNVAGRTAHSLHGYFLRAGDAREPIEYDVERLRDGHSFSTRRITASQYGQVIFIMTASFQAPEEGFEHQAEMPTVPGPDGLLSEVEMARMVKDLIPEKIRKKFTSDRPIEIRPVDPVNYFNPQKKPPVKYVWFRAAEAVAEDPALHRCLLAYASDFGLLATSMQPHGVTFVQKEMQTASLDHAMWFHRGFRIDDWLLYAMDSPSASHGRGFNRGNIYTQEGRLVASVAQEGLIRFTKGEG